MASLKSVWGIDIGQCALKALKLSEVDGKLQVDAFDVVEHERVLSEPDVDRDAAVRKAMATFLSRNTVTGDSISISVPGQSSFTRFVKLPPVEPKRIPSIVKFEAEQQIPFQIEEVIWRWQPFHDPDSPDVEVGIFAMKREDVMQVLGYLGDSELSADIVQMAPLSLYNCLNVDGLAGEQGATLLMDVGADKTDLIVSDGARLWTRTIQIGGNDFTEALVRSFKLSFAKAENLKRTAATSKYARQIFQAMRPVFADLVQEIQRSIGYYTSLHREARFKKLVGLGNGFKLPGLQKFIEQNLNISVVRIDSFNNLSLAPSVNAASFNENILSFGVAYGLAAQGLNVGVVNTNLLPDEISRKRRWDAKRPLFAVAAAVLLIAIGIWSYRQYADKSTLGTSSEAFVSAKDNTSDLLKRKKDYDALRNKGAVEVEEIESTMKLYGYRNYWPSVLSVLSRSVDDIAVDNSKLREYAANLGREAGLKVKLESAGSAENRMVLTEELNKVQEELKKFVAIPRDARQIMLVQQITTTYLHDVEKIPALGKTVVKKEPKKTPAFGFGGPMMGGPGMMGPGMYGSKKTKKTKKTKKSSFSTPDIKRGFIIEMELRTPLDKASANRFITSLGQQTRQLASKFDMFKIKKWDVVDVQSVGLGGTTKSFKVRSFGKKATAAMAGPGMMGQPAKMFGVGKKAQKTKVEEVGPALPDPIIPKEDMSDDNIIKVRWVVTIEKDGVDLPDFAVNSTRKPSLKTGKSKRRSSRRRR